MTFGHASVRLVLSTIVFYLFSRHPSTIGNQNVLQAAFAILFVGRIIGWQSLFLMIYHSSFVLTS